MLIFLFHRYRCKRLPFEAALARDMFKRKIDEIFKELLNVFGIVQWHFSCRVQSRWDKCHSGTLVLFFGEIISQHGVKPDSQKPKALMGYASSKNQKELQAFHGMINYLGKCFLALPMCVSH